MYYTGFVRLFFEIEFSNLENEVTFQIIISLFDRHVIYM